MVKEKNIGELSYLFKAAEEYRESDYFRRMMRFCTKMRHLKPFNAMLVYNQMPGAIYVFYPEEWKERFCRRIKPNARPLVVLNFKPVGYMFDLSDTVPDSSQVNAPSDEQLLWELQKENDASFEKEDNVDMDVIYRNANINGIAIDESMIAGSTLAAKIELLNQPISASVELTKKRIDSCLLPYLLSLNHNASKGEKLNSIFHELGHFFCKHLEYPLHWSCVKEETEESDEAKKCEPWEVRRISHNAREIEAESVAWLVCSRLGIKTKSERYIASLIEDTDEIPEEVDYNAIFKAANKVYEFVERMNYKEGFMYKFDKTFGK